MNDERKKQIIKLLQSDEDIGAIDPNFDVLDWEILEEDTFAMDLLGKKCPLCGYTMVSHGNPLLRHKHVKELRGANVSCPRCEQAWYIHYPVKVPNFEDMN